MISPSGMAFDIDGVVADTMSLFVRIARDEFRIDNVSYEGITSYNLEECLEMEPAAIDAIIRQLLDGSHKFPLSPIQGASKNLARLSKSTDKMLFVTARPSPDYIHHWLRDVFSFDKSKIEVVATGGFEEKADVLADRGISHFVEDRLETCFYLNERGIKPVLFRQPWNRQPHPFIEVGSWKELEALIDF
jgi:5'(3')-deoxyribonucleotidase